MNYATGLQNQGPLHGVIQFPDVAWPGMLLQCQAGVGGKAHRRLIHFARVFIQQTLGNRQYIAGARAQRLPLQRKNPQAVIQIFPETARSHFRGQIPVGGGNHADIQLD